MTGGATGALRWLVVFTAFWPVNLAVLVLSPLGDVPYVARLAIEAAVINTAMLYAALPAARRLYRPLLPGGRGLPGRPWQVWLVCYAAFTPVRGVAGATVLPALAWAGLAPWVAVTAITAAMSLVMGAVVFPLAFRLAAPWLRSRTVPTKPIAPVVALPRPDEPSEAGVIARDGSVVAGETVPALRAAWSPRGVAPDAATQRALDPRA